MSARADREVCGAGRHRQARPRPPRRHLDRGAAIVGALSLVAAGATIATAAVTTPNPTTMSAMGPISGEHGYPTWYQDSGVGDRAPLRLEQCLDLEQELCDPVFLRGEMPSPGEPMSFPDNWPLESFYMAADSSIDLPGGGGAGLTLALEATFTGEEAVDGEQIVFGRVRIRVDAPSAGTYKVIHPYGADTFEVTSPGTRSINFTEDVGIRSFAEAMRSRINPFLVREGGPIELPNGDMFIGDPAVPTRVTGSALGTNVFRIEGPDIGGPGVDVIQTDLFSLMGKISTNDGIDTQRVTYTEADGSGGYLDVFATAGPGDAVIVSGAGIGQTTLSGHNGQYFGRIPYTGSTPPGEVTVTNASDRPAAVKTVPVTDLVVVESATYDSDADTLTVQADSSDPTGPVLSMTDPSTGAPMDLDGSGSATVGSLVSPPASVTVTSSAGGSDSQPVVVTGSGVTAPDPTTAVVVAPTTAPSGSTVTLDATSSQNATSYSWTQTGGPSVSINGAGTATATFTAPAGPAELGFTLTTSGPGGTASQPFSITVPDGNAPPVAVPTASVTSALVGQTVTLDGSQSENATGYAWTQTGGTAVTLAPNGTAKTVSFVMPNSAAGVTFQLQVTSPTGATHSATVSVQRVADNLQLTSAEFRTGKREWRIDGTSSITNNNTVTVYLRTGSGEKGALVGSGQVDALGVWGVRVRGGVTPPAGTSGLIIESTRGGSITGSYATRS